MVKTLTEYKIFVASPSGLEEEKQALKELIQEYNDVEGGHRGVHFSLIGWENTLGGIGRPQSAINKDLMECDYFVMMLHDRWGQSPFYQSQKYTSGTQEEFHVALKCRKDNNYPMNQLLLFFKAVNNNQLADPGEQLKKVLEFKKERERKKDIFYHSFDTIDNLKLRLRRHLSKWLRNHESNDEINLNIIESDLEDKNQIQLKWDSFLKGESTLSPLLEKAQKLANQGKTIEAEVIFSKMIAGATDPIGYSHYAYFLRKHGQLERAKIYIKMAIDLSGCIHDKNVIAQMHRELGMLHLSKCEYNDSFNSLNSALALYMNSNFLYGLAGIYKDIGILHRKQCNFEKSLESLYKSKKLYREISDEINLATVLSFIGVIHKSLGDIKLSQKYHYEGLSILEKQPNLNYMLMAPIWGNLGITFRILGEYGKSIEFHQRALSVFEEENDYQGQLREYSCLGVVYNSMGNFAKSLEMFNKALSISEQLSSQYSDAIQYGGIGKVYYAQKKYSLAEEMHLKSLYISKEILNPELEAEQLENIGILNYERNESDLAEVYLHEALKLAIKIKTKVIIATSSLVLGKILIAKSSNKDGKKFIRQSLDISKKIPLLKVIEEATSILKEMK